MPDQPLILPDSDKALPQWKTRKFRDNHAFGYGGDFDIIRNMDGQLAAFVANPDKLTEQQRAEIAAALASPRYTRTEKPKAATK